MPDNPPAPSGAMAPPPPPPTGTTAPAHHPMASMGAMPWNMIAFFAKAGGLLLIFVGTLIGVIGLNPQTPPVNLSQYQDSLLAMRILWAMGLMAIASGAGMKLQFVYGAPSGDLPDGASRVLRAAQWRNTVTLLLCMFLLIWILTIYPIVAT
jgi:hypothetical protein